jgi:beta-lactam-binding protein with PASTA domain
MELPLEEGQAPGSVVRQNPDAGNHVRIGDVIDLWVTPQAVESTENENIQPEQ